MLMLVKIHFTKMKVTTYRIHYKNGIISFWIVCLKKGGCLIRQIQDKKGFAILLDRMVLAVGYEYSFCFQQVLAHQDKTMDLPGTRQ